MDSKITPMGVVVPEVNNYAIYSQLSLLCLPSLRGIVVVTSGIELMSSFDLYEMNFRQDKIRQQKKTVRTFTDDIDAIAYGVAAWFEENTGYSENVVGMTIEIARKLGLPESAIRKWAARRSSLNAERVKLVKPLLQRLCSEPATDRLRLQKH